MLDTSRPCWSQMDYHDHLDHPDANACQARYAATEAGGDCHMSSRAAERTFAKGVVGGPVPCDTGGVN